MLSNRRGFFLLHHLRKIIISKRRLVLRQMSTSNHTKNGITQYQSAIIHLNDLQSNAAVIQALREKREYQQEKNIFETTEYLEHSGLKIELVDDLNVIHVSGTKGKGSTCAFVESILRSLGYKTGLYTSPHLVHARERIRINSKPIDEKMFATYFFKVYNQLKTAGDGDHMPAYFKFLTLMAFHIFYEEKVDVAIIEVGIGGKYDCTNIVRKPKVCGVTTLDFDHTSILGHTIPEIAIHKAGIFKTDVTAVVSPPIPSALEVFEKTAQECKAPLYLAPEFSAYKWPESGVSLGIAGCHQQLNVSLALQLVRVWLRQTNNEVAIFGDKKWQMGEAFQVPTKFTDAIAGCRWPGRSQTVVKGEIRYFLDGAHTPKSMEMCAIWFKEQLEEVKKRRRILVFQCTADRDPKTLLPYLKELDFDVALFCPTILKVSQDKSSDSANFNQSTSHQLERSRLCAETWNELTARETCVFDCVSSLVSWIQKSCSDEATDILITGSLHLVGGVLSFVEPDVS